MFFEDKYVRYKLTNLKKLRKIFQSCYLTSKLLVFSKGRKELFLGNTFNADKLKIIVELNLLNLLNIAWCILFSHEKFENRFCLSTMDVFRKKLSCCEIM